ncbi:hypothetical protein GGR52DRAFT_589347 [Hypoxylon sp. FL1284]|nr:hypothetical protein GGR52DRAFT_589347 [Hypoxylon sp. FL1284]
MADMNNPYGHSGTMIRGLASSRHSGSASASSIPQAQAQTQTQAPITPTSPSHSRPGQSPWPQYFLVRPNITRYTASGAVTTPGPIVPLVAVDQLPEGLNLVGIPRELRLEQTIGLTNLGTVDRNPEYHQVYTDDVDDDDDDDDEHQCQQQQCPQHLTEAIEDIRQLMPSGLSSATTSLASTSSSSPPMSVSGPAPVYGYTGSLEKRPANVLPPQASSVSPSGTYPVPQLYPQLQPQQSPPCHHGVSTPVLIPTPRLPPPPQQPRSQLQSHSQPQPPPQPQPQPQLPKTQGMHPADRMLRSWYPPGVPLHPALPQPQHHPQPKTTSTSAPAPNPGSSSSNNTSSANSNSNKSSKPCRHWCLHGTCRWGGQCRFAHAMPLDAAGLRDVAMAAPATWLRAALSLALGAEGHPGLVGGGGKGGGGGGGKKGQQQQQQQQQQKDKGKAAKEKEAAGKGKGPENTSPGRRKMGPPGGVGGGGGGGAGNGAVGLQASARQELVGRLAEVVGEQKQRGIEQVRQLAPSQAPAPVPAPIPAPEEQNLVEI